MNLRYFVGHRFEYWPRDENQMANLLTNAGLDGIQAERLTWVDGFENGGQAFDFFASSTGLWFYHRLPPEIRAREEEGMRSYFQRRGVTQVTSDVVFATGTAR